MTGTVTRFDAAAGLGTITSDRGTAYAFHCTAIADGSRTIEEGTPVQFEIRPAHHGDYEAAAIAPNPHGAGRTQAEAG